MIAAPDTEHDSSAEAAVAFDDRSRTRAALVGGMLAVVVLWLVGLASCSGTVEDDLGARARAALDRAGYPDAIVSFEGRDAVLSGSAGALDPAAARRLVRGLTGVRHVVGELDGGAVVPATSSPGSSPTSVPTTTAPPPTTAVPTTAATDAVQHALDELLVGRVVEFATASATLTPAGEAVLDEIVPLLGRAPDARVQIQGHTDATGDPEANQFLSLARAEVVRQALVARGVAAERLSTVGFGGDRPDADNATAEGRQRNRRIEFALT